MIVPVPSLLLAPKAPPPFSEYTKVRDYAGVDDDARAAVAAGATPPISGINTCW